MNLRKLILTENACYKAGRKITPKGIMVHSTGANNPYLRRYVGPDDGLLGVNEYNNHWNQDKPGGRQVCVHAFIGKLKDGSIATYQTLPWNHRGWHAGGKANDTHIGFEICEDGLTDAAYFNAVYKEAVELCVYLCKLYNLTEKDVIGHCEGYQKGIASNHGDPEDKNYLAKVHNVHLAYYPKINGLKQVYWNQATSITVTAYQQKIKKYLEQMYNGCMKHLILISDDKIQTYLEEKLQAALLSSMEAILNQLYLSFSFVTYDDDCKCDFGAMEQERRKNEEEQNRLANEQIKRNMEAKKRFESGDLDENSDYYKKFIKPYEVHFSSPFVKGVIGPYKTTMHIKIQLLKNHKVLEFKQVEHHIRNTTTYNGGIEIGAGVKAGSYEIGPRAYLKFTATKGSDGQFAMDDVDITGGGNVTFKSMFTEAQAGMEASAVRGTKTYANFSVSGEKLINSDFRKSMGFWFPKLKKEIWRGEYPVY